MKKKQRQLTDKQRTLLKMQLSGASDHAIAAAIGTHIGTVRAKRAAINRGISKGAYSDVSAFVQPNYDLFSEGCAA